MKALARDTDGSDNMIEVYLEKHFGPHASPVSPGGNPSKLQTPEHLVEALQVAVKYVQPICVDALLKFATPEVVRTPKKTSTGMWAAIHFACLGRYLAMGGKHVCST